MFDPEVFKKQFPLFDQPENRKLVYLDNAATCQRPQCVIDAICGFYLHCNANAHRSSHRLGRRATDVVESTRRLVADFIGADNPEEIVFTSGATEGLNLLAYTLCQTLEPGDEIILSRSEHHANLVPWQMMAEHYRLQLRFIPDDNGMIKASKLDKVLSPRTRIVSVTAASNVLGYANDIHAIAEDIGSKNITLIVDGSQIPAHNNVKVTDWPCDFFVCSAHKFYGPTGIGFLYGRRAKLAKLPPFKGGGGGMVESTDLETSCFAPPPHRFEAGTPALADIAGMKAAIAFLLQQDRPAMQAYEHELCVYLHQQLAALPFIQLLSRPDNNLGIAFFVAADNMFSAMDVATWLDEQDIAVRAGHHCAQPLMAANGITRGVRVSLAAYNTRQDIDRLIQALQAFYTGMLKAPDSENEIADLTIDELLAQKGLQQRYKTLMQLGQSHSGKSRSAAGRKPSARL